MSCLFIVLPFLYKDITYNEYVLQIKEACDAAVLLNAKGEPRSGGGGAAKSAAKSNEPKPVKRPGGGPPPVSHCSYNMKSIALRYKCLIYCSYLKGISCGLQQYHDDCFTRYCHILTYFNTL